MLAFLRQRQGLLDAVVFSGGEPTVDPYLVHAIGQVRALGYAIGLHSAGAYPRRLAEVLPLLDWVGLDYKAPYAQQDAITGMRGSAARVHDCARQVVQSGVAYEMRCTLHPDLHDRQSVPQICAELRAIGAQHIALQQ